MQNLNLEKLSKLVNEKNPKFAKDLRKKMRNKEHYTYCTYAGNREEIVKIFLKEFPKKIEYDENDGERYEIKYIGYCGRSNTLRFGVTKKVPFWLEAKTDYIEISNIKKFLVKMKYPRI